jgi:hypothetical protein
LWAYICQSAHKIWQANNVYLPVSSQDLTFSVSLIWRLIYSLKLVVMIILSNEICWLIWNDLLIQTKATPLPKTTMTTLASSTTPVPTKAAVSTKYYIYVTLMLLIKCLDNIYWKRLPVELRFKKGLNFATNLNNKSNW